MPSATHGSPVMADANAGWFSWSHTLFSRPIHTAA